MALTQEEINKIHEEEAERAKAQTKFAPKKKSSCLQLGCLGIVLVIAIPIIISTLHDTTKTPADIQQEQAQTQNTLQELGRVEIISSEIQFDRIGTPQLVIKLKNNAGQAVDAVTLETYLLNNFDEPIGEWNVKTHEPFRGILQETIESGATYTASFNLAVYDQATKVDATAVVKVHYVDGSSYAL